MKRLYYLADDLDSTERIANHLHQAGISDWHFHVVSRDEAGLYRRHIHGATLWQKQDLVRLGERGAFIGLAVGGLLASVFMITEPFGDGINGPVSLVVLLVITLFGTWVGGLVGLSTENQNVARFHREIDAGKNLLMIDVGAPQEALVRELMATKHPEARLVLAGSSLASPFDSSNRAVA